MKKEGFQQSKSNEWFEDSVCPSPLQKTKKKYVLARVPPRRK